jgi:hypothetical protein
MNILDYLTNAMTGGQPTQQELMARQMAQQGLLGTNTSLMTPEEFKTLQMAQPKNTMSPLTTSREAQYLQNPINPNQMTATEGQYMQNLINPGKTMQQNYMDPRLIEQMYYRGLLSQ